MDSVLSIDVGTATIGAVLASGGRVTVVREPGSGATTWPAGVQRAAGGVLLGTAAERAKWSDPAAHHPHPRAAGAWALTEAIHAVRAAAGVTGGRLVLVADDDAETGDLLAAAAGLDLVEVVPAAVAAALDALPDPGGDVLVVDAGARCVVSLVRFAAGGPARVVWRRRVTAGGDDLDARIVERALAGPVPEPGTRERFEADDLARRLRHQLTDAEVAEDMLNPLAPPYRMIRHDLVELAAPGLAGLTATDGARPAAVVLAGGAARMPVLAEAVERAYPGLVVRPTNPELAAARGGARWGADTARRTVVALPAPVVVPVSWTLPEGAARLTRWLAGPGDRIVAGQPLVRVRTADDQVRVLASRVDGLIGAILVGAGEPLASGAVAATLRPSALVRSRAVAPVPVWRARGDDGPWRPTPDRTALVRFERDSAVVRGFADGAERLRIAIGGQPRHEGPLVLTGPDGRPMLFSEHDTGRNTRGLLMSDLSTGREVHAFAEQDAFRYLVHPRDWVLHARCEGRRGLLKRRVSVLYDLATGRRIGEFPPDRLPGQYSRYGWRQLNASAADPDDGFPPRGSSPDGTLTVTLTPQDSGRGFVIDFASATTGRAHHQVKRPCHLPAFSTQAGVAFDATGEHVAVTWPDAGRYHLEVWRV